MKQDLPKPGRSLKANLDSAVWHEVLDGLPKLQPSSSSAAVDDTKLEQLRNEADTALAKEAAGFEQRQGELLATSSCPELARRSGDLGGHKLFELPPLSAESSLKSCKQQPERRWRCNGVPATKDGACCLQSKCLKRAGPAGKNRADARWLQQVRKAGTTADRLAAATLLLRESPLANLKSLDELLTWVGKRSGARGAAGQAIDALKELFSSALLPDRRLLFFEQQPLSSVPSGKAGRDYILLWYFEDALKKRFLEFVKLLQAASRDNLEYIKGRAIRAIYDLLRSKPEQEAVLLMALVNKLGDPSRKMASQAGFHLGQLLEEHPAMSLVVAKETERFLFQPNLPARAVYYTVVFLNQIILSRKPSTGGSSLAAKLVSIYFTLFHLVLEGKAGHAADMEKKQQEDNAGKKAGKKAGKRKRGRKAGSKGPGGKHKNEGNNRSPAKPSSTPEVDAKLLAALLAGVRRAFPFLAEADTEELMQQHSTDLFRVVHTATFGVAVQAMSLLFQLLDARSAVSDRYYRALYGMLLAPDLASSNKSTMFLSLLFKSLKADVSQPRILAFIKRLLQVAAEQLPNFTCGSLLLVSELLKGRPALWSSVLEPEDSDKPEQFQDAPDESDMEDSPSPELQQDKLKKHHGSLTEAASGHPEGSADQNLAAAYDMTKRDPLYCNAQQACLWELVILAGHAHPSVAAMANSLLTGMPVDYLGDPMRDLSISAFLDKFMAKKAKASGRTSSLMQPKDRISAADVSSSLNELEGASAPPESAYFAKFYEVKAQREKLGQRSKKKAKQHLEESALLEGDEEMSSGSEAESEGMDDVMEEAEIFDGEDADYDQLAAAMEDDDVIGDDNEEDLPSFTPEIKGSAKIDPDSENESLAADSETFSDASEGSQEGLGLPDVDLLRLGAPSDDESSEEAEEDSESTGSESEWVLAEGAAQLFTKPEASEKRNSRLRTAAKEKASMSHAPKATVEIAAADTKSSKAGRKKSARGKDKDVFASADDFASLLDKDDLEGDDEQADKRAKGRVGKRKREQTLEK